MVEFKAESTTLAEVARLLHGAVAVFDDRVEQAEHRVRSVVGASWSGDDAELFLQGWESWRAASADVRFALAQLAMQLQQTSGQYESGERSLSGAYASGGTGG